VRLTVATWNINSVRLRIRHVARFLGRHAPDVLCLQETKCRDESFPRLAFEKLGYSHIAVHGQKGWHGVAIVSRYPFADISRDRFCEKADARHISVVFDGAAGLAKPLMLHNFYVPAGGDEPDPAINEKFAHKLAFLDELERCSAARQAAAGERAILVGDLNVAPLEHDVWSHKQLLDVVSHTPIEVEKLGNVKRAGGWIDVMRDFVPEPAKLYTWWSYRASNWIRADKGRRLDHIWASPALQGAAQSMSVTRETRGWARPSDHVPVIAAFDVEDRA
jgi:exodeoxyribonuclease-3